MPTFDFSAPFVAARIITPDGSAFPLWTNIGGAETTTPTVPGTEAIRALSFVQEVQVQLNLSGVPIITVQLAPPFEAGMAFLDSPLADGLMRNRIEVQLGYAGGTSDGGAILSAPFAAALVAPEVTIDTSVQISLKGQGLGTTGGQQGGGRAVAETRETRRDLISRIAAGPGGGRRALKVDFSMVDQNPRSQSYRELGESASGFVQGNRSDWFALWELAERTHCVMSIVGPTEEGTASRLMWMPKSDLWSRPATRRYRFHNLAPTFQGRTSDALNRDELAEFPMLSFSCNTEAVWNAVSWNATFNHGARMDEVNADTVEPGTTPVTIEGSREPVDGSNGSQTLEATDEVPLDGDEGRMPMPGEGTHADTLARVEAEVAAGAGMAVECQIEVIGDPTIQPGDIIRLGGLGRRFDDRVYRVYQIVHAIGTGGFTTTLTVTSNIDVADEEAGREPEGPRNTSEGRTAVDEFLADSRDIPESEFEGLTGLNLPPL